jgi:hypothetical protein
MNCSTVRRIVVVTARRQYAYSLSGRFIEGEGIQTSARTADAARLAAFTLAGEADALIVKGLRWAASMLFYLFRQQRPAAPAALRDAALMAETCEPTPLRAWRQKFAEWAVQHPITS